MSAPDHGATVEQVHLPAGRPFRASCLCGWQSNVVATRPGAVEAAQAHLGEQTPQLVEMVDGIVQSTPEVTAGFSPEVIADCRQAALAAAYRTVQRIIARREADR